MDPVVSDMSIRFALAPSLCPAYNVLAYDRKALISFLFGVHVSACLDLS